MSKTTAAEREEAVKSFSSWHGGTIPDRLRAFWDEARSSRDAEVAAAVARAEAAEAVIAAVREALGRVMVAFDAAPAVSHPEPTATTQRRNES